MANTSKYLALLILAGSPAYAVVTDGRDPNSIPNIPVVEPLEWDDIDHPEFEPYPVEADKELLDNAVFEQFTGTDDEIFSRWQVSAAEREPGSKYVGEWAIEEPNLIKGFNNDRGLVLKSENAAGAIARKFDHPIDTTSGTKPFVLQYELKNQAKLRCGGAYIKVLPASGDVDYAKFGNETPYLVMFGPDRCGSTDKVHFILKRDGVEHHLKQPPRMHDGLLTSLYTLIVQPNLDFEIRIDGQAVRGGSMLDELEFDPPFTPPRDIRDPNAKRPDDWVVEEYIPDPNEATKPEDWDETQPRLISDPDAVKPEAWHEDIPLFIADPDAVKPGAWDDEEDGQWKAPEIKNPKCLALNEEAGEGCGPWTAPLIKNPKFKGKWSQPLIPNPDYKGEWTPGRIPNPDFHEEEYIAQLSKWDHDVGGIGFELLTVQGNSLFDNIYVGSSLRDAENIGNATWSPKFVLESESEAMARKAQEKRAEEVREKAYEEYTASDEYLNSEAGRAASGHLAKYKREFERLKSNPVGYSTNIYNEYIDTLRVDKMEAFTSFPVTSAVVMSALTVFTMLFFGIVNALRVAAFGSSPKAPVSKNAKAEAEAKAEAKAKTEAANEAKAKAEAEKKLEDY